MSGGLNTVYNMSEDRRVFAPLNTLNDHRSVYQVLEEKTPSSTENSTLYIQRNGGSYQTKSSYASQSRPQVGVSITFIFILSLGISQYFVENF